MSLMDVLRMSVDRLRLNVSHLNFSPQESIFYLKFMKHRRGKRTFRSMSIDDSLSHQYQKKDNT